MGDSSFSIDQHQIDNDVETEDGEIDDSSSADVKIKELEIENYYLSLNSLGCDLRCSCCGDVFSDPVKLQCHHLIDRSCAVMKKNGNIIECPFCHNSTICDDVDLLVTDFNIASRIPPKPETLVAIINKHGDHLMKREQRSRELCTDEECCSSDGGSSKPKKRRRKTRWDKIEVDVHRSFSGAIRDILSTHNVPKNITLSQFKKFTEISSKTSIMSLLTKAVMQSVHNGVNRRNAKKGGTYTDSEILEMIPSDDLKDFFEVEKTQFMMLYRDALDRGVIVPSSQKESLKPPLLPTPKQSSNYPEISKHTKPSWKKPFHESIEADFSHKSSETSFSDSDMSPGVDLADMSKPSKIKRTHPSTRLSKNDKTHTHSEGANVAIHGNTTITSPSSCKNDISARQEKDDWSKGKHNKESVSLFGKSIFAGDKNIKRGTVDDKSLHRDKYVKEYAADVKTTINTKLGKGHTQDSIKRIISERSRKGDLKRDKHAKRSVSNDKQRNESVSYMKREDHSVSMSKHANENVPDTKHSMKSVHSSRHNKGGMQDERYKHENRVSEKCLTESLSSPKHDREDEPSAKHGVSHHTKESVEGVKGGDVTASTVKHAKENLQDEKLPKESLSTVKCTKNSLVEDKVAKKSVSNETLTKDMGANVQSEQKEVHARDDNNRYRESISRLHSIYSSMYEASLVMKELEHQMQSPQYQDAYKTYSDNYTKYQTLYSSLQTTTSVDSVVTERNDPVTKSTITANKLVSAINEEPASSTISPCNYAPDSTESISDIKTPNATTNLTLTNSTPKSDVPLSLSELRQHRKRTQSDYKKKFGYLWISNLCKETKTNDLCKLFGKFGHVSKIKLFQYKAQSPMTFFSLIFMPNIDEAEVAYRQLQNTSFFDRQINIKMLENNPLSDDRLI